MVDWKQRTQSYAGVGQAGLAISRVTDNISTHGTGPWAHDSAEGVTELQRAATLGNVGWQDNVTYTFDLVFTPTLAQVFVDGVEELSVAGSFNDGAFGFYNYSQSQVSYAGITSEEVAIPSVPEPLPILLFGAGLALIAGARKRKSVSN